MVLKIHLAFSMRKFVKIDEEKIRNNWDKILMSGKVRI